ncbi:MAG: hypothetical protein KKC05_03220, partial [Nanoarchaeota archaeon]|nr:hypothetical protein [Nanoarchaeota archaeon]
LADKFSILTLDPVIILNTKQLIKSEAFPFPSVCSGFYNQLYSVSYPLVIRVHDSVIDNYFQFANFVFVDDMQPGSCDALSVASSCSNLGCNAQITAIDGNDNPIPGTNVYIGGCLIGSTNANGLAQGSAPCGNYSLLIFNSSDMEYVNEHVFISGNYQNTFKLNNIPNTTFTFAKEQSSCTNKLPLGKELVLLRLKSDTNKDYTITNNQPIDISSCMSTSGADVVCDICTNSSQTNEDACKRCQTLSIPCIQDTLSSSADVTYIPAGEYKTSAVIFNTEKINTLSGTEYTFVAIPIQTSETTIEIPQENSEILVRLPDTYYAYDQAIVFYDWLRENTYREGKCEGLDLGPLGCEGNKIDEEQSKSRSAADVIELIQIPRPMLAEVCS